MSTGSHFEHPSRPCWYCAYWVGTCSGDPYLAHCRRDGRDSCRANAPNGCVHWMRETGVDDEPWEPPPWVSPMKKRPGQRDAGRA